MKPFSLNEINFNGIHLVEASAGTGKTYNITAIFLKAIAERKLSVNQILVVTFTNAATSELRTRIGEVLKTAAEYFENPTIENAEPFIKEIYQAYSSDDNARMAILKAAREYDQMAVSTIHGFCQQMLQEFVFESNSHFDIAYTGDETDILTEAADNLWRELLKELERNNQKQSNPFIERFLMEEVKSPDELTKKCRPYLSNDLLHTFGKIDVNRFIETYLTLLDKFKSLFDATEIRDLLYDDVLNKNSYNPKSIDEIIEVADEYVRNEKSDFSMVTHGKFQLLTSYKVNKSTKKGLDSPEHPLFEVANELLNLPYSGLIETWWVEIAERFKAKVKTIKQYRRIRSFNDILNAMSEALETEKMQELVAERYPVALVDEFQDTDPVQANIFGKIYFKRPESTIFFIGDPKQSIYAFRSADINTYQSIREKNGVHLYGLDKNFRSAREIVESVNILFKSGDQEKWPGGIKFAESTHEHSLTMLVKDEQTATGTFFLQNDNGTEVVKDKSLAQDESYSLVCDEIVELLSTETYLVDKTGNRSRLQAADIAILVFAHKEASTFKKKLAKLNIKAVTQSGSSVFISDECDFLIQLLNVIEQPSRLPVLRYVLNSPFIGIKYSEIDASLGDEAVSPFVTHFQELKLTYDHKGLAACINHFLSLPISRWNNQELSVREFIAVRNDAERVFTNIRHIAEIVGNDEFATSLSPSELAVWLAHQKETKSGENMEVRLESDENAVKIMTVHSCKGLQFPIVFCPFLWSKQLSNRDSSTPCVFYDDEGKQQVRFNKLEDVEKESVKSARLEEFIRLFYVALTRAKYRNYICISNHIKINLLDWVLNPDKSIRNFNSFNSGRKSTPNLHSLAKNLSIEHPDLFHCKTPSIGEKVSLSGSESTNFTKKIFSRDDVYLPSWVLTSYSGLKKGLHSEADLLESKFAEFEEPAKPTKELNIFNFPRGANAGVFMHKLFEDLSFKGFDESAKDYIKSQLDEFGFEEKWLPVIYEMMQQVLGKPLPASGVRMHDIEEYKNIKEMEFYFPFSKANASQIMDIIHGSETKFEHSLPGFMNGFIDLLFEYEGKFYVLDYKSDHLGNSAEDYSPATIQKSIEDKGYIIQYHLYTLAVTRYLKQFYPDYSYEKHFGGCYYLYLRGVNEKSDSGMYFIKPKAETIDSLDTYFKGEPAL